MRQETNNEMDLLLRRLSRRGDGGARNGETGPDDRHLDVDELSSYAQNALPAATRARYTEHLAECVSCRKLVTELAVSLGAATAAAPGETGVAATGLKAFLASLFSPMVLRYAVPALGMVLVMVVGFVVFRQQQKEAFVARLTEQKQPAPQAIEPGLVSPTPLQGYTDSAPAKAGSQPQSETGRVDQPTAGKRADTAGEGAATGVAAPVTKSTDDLSRSETRPAVAAAEPPPAAPKAAADEVSKETNKEKKAEAQAKKQPESTDIVVDGANANANKPANEATTRNVSELPVQSRRYEQLQKLRPGAATAGRANTEKDAADKDQTEKEEAAERRSVAGRTFKKQRGIWIDTAYDSSTRTMSLPRGSERFRSVVADEPAINTIAEQLDGEVIVVWKGRAYRIH